MRSSFVLVPLLASFAVACSSSSSSPGAVTDAAGDASTADVDDASTAGDSVTTNDAPDAADSATANDAGNAGDSAIANDAGNSGDSAIANDGAVEDIGPPPDVGVSCDATKKASVWSSMVQAPIEFLGKAANLDLAGGTLTLAQAEAIDCDGADLGDQYGDGTRVIGWGDNSEVWLDYDRPTLHGIFMSLWPGYIGEVAFKDSTGAHTYAIGVEEQIKKDGAPFSLGSGWAGDAFDAKVDELTRALLATYAPSITQDPAGTTCVTSGKCVIGNFGDIAYLDVPAVGFALWIDNRNAADPVPSIPTRLDVFDKPIAK